MSRLQRQGPQLSAFHSGGVCWGERGNPGPKVGGVAGWGVDAEGGSSTDSRTSGCCQTGYTRPLSIKVEEERMMMMKSTPPTQHHSGGQGGCLGTGCTSVTGESEPGSNP
jgi:hypothetical protein